MTTRYGVDESGLTKQTSGGKSDDVDIGFVKPFGGMVVPPGYLYCDGSEVSRQAYDKLFAVIGTTWGEGDGVETFNIPDLRGIFVRGDGGENNADIGVQQEDAIRNLTGSFAFYGQQMAWLPVASANGVFNEGAVSSTPAYTILNGQQRAGVSVSVLLSADNVVPTAPENRPINVAMKYCIRYE